MERPYFKMKSIYRCSVDELVYAFEIILSISTAALQSNTLILKINIHKKKYDAP